VIFAQAQAAQPQRPREMDLLTMRRESS
jgi:hypothetical protein